MGRSLSIDVAFPVAQVSGPAEQTSGPSAAPSSWVSMRVGQLAVTVASGNPDRRFSVEELRKVARSITAAGDATDPATWVDAREAFPTR